MQRVLFIGGFACGKRSLVDALLRKQVLISSVMPMAGDRFVTEIVSGDSERLFSVNEDGYKECLNLDNLRQTMLNDSEVNPLLRDTEYIVHECPAQANNLAFIIANPYMLYDYEHGQYGREILTHPCWKNDAVVYVLNATMPFTQPDCDYIEHLLSDGSNSNLFFCINRIDCVKEEYVSEIKKITMEKLKKVFTKNGVFDEALYQSRVFFISTYHSLNARLGKPSHFLFGDVYVNDIDTGVPEFEYTLRKFLQKQSIEKQRAMEQQR